MIEARGCFVPNSKVEKDQRSLKERRANPNKNMLYHLCPNILLIIMAIISMNNLKVQGFTSYPHHFQRSLSGRLSSLHIFGDDSLSGSTMDPVLEIPLLEAKLVAAKEEDIVDEEFIQELQQKIGDAKTSAEFGVRRAQLQFYEAFASGDYEGMASIWSKKSPVSCVHPCQRRLEGYDAVMQSWKEILAVSGLAAVTSFEGDEDEDDEFSFRIEPEKVQMEICGSTAIVNCVEKTGTGDAPPLEAVNIYKREDGVWKMTMHMAAPVISGAM